MRSGAAERSRLVTPAMRRRTFTSCATVLTLRRRRRPRPNSQTSTPAACVDLHENQGDHLSAAPASVREPGSCRGDITGKSREGNCPFGFGLRQCLLGCCGTCTAHFIGFFCLLNHFVYFCSDFYRVTTFLENLEMSGNLTAVGEMLGNWSCQGKVRRKSCE